MPFTLAHPAVVLPIRHHYVDKPALIVGSLAPDFVYFLAGRASSDIGHTLFGMVFINLPLCVILFFAYAYIAKTFWAYMPKCFNLNHQPIFYQSVKTWLIFTLSAWFGMLTHIVWDSFTHNTGFMVVYLPFLQLPIMGLPIFKWLQYSGGVLGCLFIMLYWLWTVKQNQHKNNKQTVYINPIHKLLFWFMVVLGAVILLALWQMGQTISHQAYATWVIRLIDCLAILTFIGLWIMQTIHQTKTP